MARPRLLIVDDERNIRLALAAALEDVEAEIETAVTGEEALEKVEAAPVDLMVLDLKMPGIGGMATLRALSERRPEVRVIILTAHGSIDSAVEALKLGAVDFLQKPCTPDEIRELVGRVLRRGELSDDETDDLSKLLELARRAASERRLASAEEFLRRAVKLEPNSPEAFCLLGMLLEVRGQVHEALGNYRAALSFDPTNRLARENLDRATEMHRRPPSLSSLTGPER